MTFNWVQFNTPDKPDWVMGLNCYYTRKQGKAIHICTTMLVEKDDQEQTKQKFEETRHCVVEDGAWEPTEDAKWYWNGRSWCIDKKYIKLLN